MQVYAHAGSNFAVDKTGLQLFADKDGLVEGFLPRVPDQVFAMANIILAGAKIVFIRDVENQFLFSGAPPV